MPYVNHRWLGGLLTNFQTMSERIRRLHDLERYETEGQLELLPTRERGRAGRPREAAREPRRRQEHEGHARRDVRHRPQDRGDRGREAQRLRIPIIALVDTNCDPDGIDYVIPATTTRSARAR